METIETSSKETSSVEVNTSHGAITNIGTSQVNTTQISPIPVTHNNVSKGEISSTSSIKTQSFLPNQPFTTHNISQELQDIELAAIGLWQQFHSTTPIDLTFDIANLPTGQLAEATITGYDQNGRPNTATITIDNDANGVGWFIDSTPQDNSEFTGSDNYFQAAPNSDASSSQ